MNTHPASKGSARGFFSRLWRNWLALSRTVQAIIIAVLVILLLVIIVLARGSGKDANATVLPTVTLQSVQSFGGSSDGVSVLGTVQSVSEADLLAQSGGTVTAVHTSIGATVPAGFVIANLDSSAASAAVLQAQGAYDAARAAQRATTLQAQNSSGSLEEQQVSISTAYSTDYTTTKNTLTNQVDQLFGNNTPVGPQLLINPLTTGDTLSRERRALDAVMDSWQASLATSNSTDPLTLLANTQTYLTKVSSFLSDLSTLASTQGSAATPAQLAALATAQSTINGMLASVSTMRTAYNGAVTAAAVGKTQSQGSANGSVTSSEATVEQALGGLRSAQAAYEKTVIRAPIAGTVNYLPISVGDFASPNQHVATVARNNALEVIINLSQNDRNRVAVGDTLTISGTYKGVVTTISPALDPVTKQIEVHVAVNDGANLVNGQSVQVSLPTPATGAVTLHAATTTPTTSSTTVSIQLPLAAVKLLPNERDVFTVDATGHIVAHKVDIGDVIGDRIIVTTPLDPNLMIVSDARGLSDGDQVVIATSTQQ